MQTYILYYIIPLVNLSFVTCIHKSAVQFFVIYKLAEISVTTSTASTQSVLVGRRKAGRPPDSMRNVMCNNLFSWPRRTLKKDYILDHKRRRLLYKYLYVVLVHYQSC